ncbi:hypothetical protein BH10BAC4_BH10BAC4_20310 [soil metagenome]
MIAKLSNDQIDLVLKTEVVGRIGCHADGKVYIVPIVYVFDGNHIYAHSKEGQKLRMMRQNPDVCFEVDHIDGMAAWQSVIVWGRFEEVKNETILQQKGIKLLSDRLTPLTLNHEPKQLDDVPSYYLEKNMNAILFRIKVIEKTGRFETH